MGVGRPIATSKGASLRGDIVTKTTAPITYYVRTDGDDNNDGLTPSTAFATISKAISQLPKFIEHDVTIDIGEGTFNEEVDIVGFHIKNSAFTVSGKLGFPTLTSGTTSGTATGGDTITLVDSSQNWTTDELRGKFLKVGEEYRLIRKNTSNTIYCGADFSASVNGKAYGIYEPKTKIVNAYPINILGIYCHHYYYLDALIIENIHAEGTGSNYSVGVSCSGVYGVKTVLRNMWANNGEEGFYFSDVSRLYSKELYAFDNLLYGFFYVDCRSMFVNRIGAYHNNDCGFYLQNSILYNIDCFFDNNTKHGAEIWIPTAEFDFETHAYAENNGQHGLLFYGALFADMDGGEIRNNGGYGIYIDESSSGNRAASSFINMVGNCIIDGNALGGIKLNTNSGIALSNCSGTNTGYGIELDNGSYALITGQTSLTGSAGDITMDGGATSLSYSIDFANVGDKVTNLSNLCYVKRVS